MQIAISNSPKYTAAAWTATLLSTWLLKLMIPAFLHNCIMFERLINVYRKSYSFICSLARSTSSKYLFHMLWALPLSLDEIKHNTGKQIGQLNNCSLSSQLPDQPFRHNSKIKVIRLFSTDFHLTRLTEMTSSVKFS